MTDGKQEVRRGSRRGMSLTLLITATIDVHISTLL